MENGEARVIGVPTATASAEALQPGPEPEPPEYLIYEFEGKPVTYKRYREED